MKYFARYLLVSLISTQALAAEAYSLKLNRGDSVVFSDILAGFSGPKKTVDPEHPSVFYSKLWYQSQNQAVTMVCSTAIIDGEFYATDCSFAFLPENSGIDVIVERKANGVVRATILDPAVATQMYKNLAMNPFYSNETVSVMGASGAEEISRLYAECNPVAIASTDAKTCIIEFLPD